MKNLMRADTISAQDLEQYYANSEFRYVVKVFAAETSFYVGPYTIREQAQEWVDVAKQLANWQVSVCPLGEELQIIKWKKEGLSPLDIINKLDQQRNGSAPAAAFDVANNEYDTDQD